MMPSPDAATELAPVRGPTTSRGPTTRRVAREATTVDAAPSSSARGKAGETVRPTSWRAIRIAPSWALPPLVYLAATALASAQIDATEVAEGRFLGLLAACVVAVIVALERQAPRRAVLASAWTGIGVVTTLWVLHHGAHRGTVATWILIAGLGWSLARAVRARGATPSVAIPAALGFQLVMRPDLLLPPLLDARTVVSVVGLPVAAGVALAALAAAFGTRRAVLAAALVAVLAPGWNVHVTATLIVVAAGLPLVGLHRRERRGILAALGVIATAAGLWIVGDLQGATAGTVALALTVPTRGALGRVAGRAASGLVVIVAGLATYPWCRTDPLLNLAGSTGRVWPWILAAGALGVVALWAIDRDAEPTRQRRAVTAASIVLLTAASLLLPRPIEVTFTGPPPLTLDRQTMEIALDAATRRVTIDTDLVHGDRLVESAAVARVFWLSADDAEKDRWALRAGQHTADWSAGRPNDGPRAPAPWLHRLAPSGDFFAQRYRMTITLDAELATGDRLVIRRVPRLDPAVRLRVHRVEQHP